VFKVTAISLYAAPRAMNARTENSSAPDVIGAPVRIGGSGSRTLAHRRQ
jgi:hypothetical protein